MKKKLFSIALIVVLISFTIAPLWGYSCFVYGSDNNQQQEQTLTDNEKLSAGFLAYLNSRNGWVASQFPNPISENISNLINMYYLANQNAVISKLDLLAGIIIKYSPFRVSLRGSAVRAFNDIYDYLIASGKLTNLDSSTGGNTSDSLYSGYIYNNSLTYLFRERSGDPGFLNCEQQGSVMGGVTGESLYNEYNSVNTGDWWDESNILRPTIATINYASDVTAQNIATYRARSTTGELSTYAPYIAVNAIDFPVYSRDKVIVSCSAMFKYTYTSASKFYYGFVAYYPYLNKWKAVSFGEYTRNDMPQCNINFDTEDFEKTNPVIPENDVDKDVDYIPSDKDTGDTFNTYNEYINKEIIKKTIINKQDPDNPGGGGSGSSGSGSGTITPDGNGGYNFNLPDIGWPDFSGFDFNISGLSEKFPFSIPFDLMAFFTVLNAEPETPEIQGDIDLGIVNWEIDWNLHDFDGLAVLLRNLEFIGFCISLILITRSIIKG